MIVATCSAIVNGRRCLKRSDLTGVQIVAQEGPITMLNLPKRLVIYLCRDHFQLKPDVSANASADAEDNGA